MKLHLCIQQSKINLQSTQIHHTIFTLHTNPSIFNSAKPSHAPDTNNSINDQLRLKKCEELGNTNGPGRTRSASPRSRLPRRTCKKLAIIRHHHRTTQRSALGVPLAPWHCDRVCVCVVLWSRRRNRTNSVTGKSVRGQFPQRWPRSGVGMSSRFAKLRPQCVNWGVCTVKGRFRLGMRM